MAPIVGRIPGHPDAGRDEFIAHRARRKEQLGAPVVRHSPAGFQHDDPVHVRRPGVEAVFDDQQRCPGGVQRLDDRIADLKDPGRVEVRRGFVEQHQARSHGKDSGEGQPLFLPARKRARRMVQRNVQADRVECLDNPPLDFRGRDRQVLGAKGHVVPDPGLDHLGFGVLLHEPHQSAALGRGLAIEQEFTGGVCLVVFVKDPGQGIEERGLAGTGGAGQAARVGPRESPGRVPTAPGCSGLRGATPSPWR